MIWILALLCLGIFTTLGWLRGPVRALFALAGLVAGAVAAGAGGTAIKPLFAFAGLTRPLFLHVIPPLVVFLVVLAVCAILGSAVHRKLYLRQKYGPEEVYFNDWEKAFHLAGLGVGAWVGTALFFLLLVPIYSTGYFTTQFYPRNDGPAWARAINQTFSEIRSLKLDGALGLCNPIPNTVYDTSDLVATVAANPALASRLANYPAFLSLGEMPELNQLGADPDFARVYNNANSHPADVLAHPKVRAILSNAALSQRVYELAAANVGDLKSYLLTGQSPKYASGLAGFWIVDLNATFAKECVKLTNATAAQIVAARVRVSRKVASSVLTATVENQFVLKQGAAIAARGSWKQTGSSDYHASLQGAKPVELDVNVNGNQLFFDRDNLTLVFNRQL